MMLDGQESRQGESDHEASQFSLSLHNEDVSSAAAALTSLLRSPLHERGKQQYHSQKGCDNREIGSPFSEEITLQDD